MELTRSAQLPELEAAARELLDRPAFDVGAQVQRQDWNALTTYPPTFQEESTGLNALACESTANLAAIDADGT